MVTSTADQRRSRRYGVQFPCVVSPKEGRKKSPKPSIEVKTKDVSKGGLYFVASVDWKVGTAVECVIELPLEVFSGQRRAIRCRGKIARLVPEAEGRIGVGVTIDTFQFIELEKSQLGIRAQEKTSPP